MILSPFTLSIALAFSSTGVLILLGTPLAWWLARSRSLWAILIETLVSLPLVLPPTVLGFYLLLLLNPHSPLGSLWLSLTGETLVFSFSGLLIGSLVYSLPFVIRPLMSAFATVDNTLLEAAATMRADRWDRFCSIVLPLAKPGYISAAVLGFAHTLGEFGVVLMLGGNIPGKTRTVSIAIYDAVEQMNYTEAHWLSASLLGFSFVILVALFVSQRTRSLRSNPPIL